MEIQAILDNFRRHGFTALYFETEEEAGEYVLRETAGKTTGIGGSMTIRQLNIYDRMAEAGEVYWHWENKDPKVRELAAGAQVYLCSANALSEKGEIVNIDGTGNRLASTMYGHELVMILAGINKLCPDLESAIFRARNIAAPLNARRFGLGTPCAVIDPMRCHDCSHEQRICRGMTILTRNMRGIGETRLILIGKELGY